MTNRQKCICSHMYLFGRRCFQLSSVGHKRYLQQLKPNIFKSIGYCYFSYAPWWRNANKTWSEGIFFYSRGHRWKIQDHVLKSFESQKITVLFRLTYYNIFALVVFLVCRIFFKVKCNLYHISLANNCWKKIYSQTYFQRPLRGNLKSGHLRQVAFNSR